MHQASSVARCILHVFELESGGAAIRACRKRPKSSVRFRGARLLHQAHMAGHGIRHVARPFCGAVGAQNRGDPRRHYWLYVYMVMLDGLESLACDYVELYYSIPSGDAPDDGSDGCGFH